MMTTTYKIREATTSTDLTGSDFASSSACGSDNGTVWNGYFTGSPNIYMAQPGSVGGGQIGPTHKSNSNTSIQKVGTDWVLKIFCCNGAGSNCTTVVWHGEKSGGTTAEGDYERVAGTTLVDTIEVVKVCDCGCCCGRVVVTVTDFTTASHKNGVYVFDFDSDTCEYTQNMQDPANTGGSATLQYSGGTWYWYCGPTPDAATASFDAQCPLTSVSSNATYDGKHGTDNGGTIKIECGD